MLGLERVEILAKVDGHERASRSAPDLGLVSQHVGGAWALGRARDTTLSYNRTVGFGLERPGSAEDVAALKTFYAGHGIPAFRIALCPVVEPAGFETTLAAAGFGTYPPVFKWERDASAARAAATEFRIDRAIPDEADAMDTALLAAFGGWPLSVPLASPLVGTPHWHHYVARDGDAIVAVAAMYVREGLAWLGAAGTLATHRGRGAQGALIARRIDDARALGCHTLTTETGPDPPGKPNPSPHNLERAGFRVAYVRPIWVFRGPA